MKKGLTRGLKDSVRWRREVFPDAQRPPQWSPWNTRGTSITRSNAEDVAEAVDWCRGDRLFALCRVAISTVKEVHLIWLGLSTTNGISSSGLTTWNEAFVIGAFLWDRFNTEFSVVWWWSASSSSPSCRIRVEEAWDEPEETIDPEGDKARPPMIEFDRLIRASIWHGPVPLRCRVLALSVAS